MGRKVVLWMLAAVLTLHACSWVAAEGRGDPGGDPLSLNYAPASVSEDGVEINAENFPDPVFRGVVKELDRNGNGILEKAEADYRKTLRISNREIKSLKGIEFFPSLVMLYCGGNQISSLDVSHNPALTVLSCGSNQLESLDVSKNMALIELSCGSNQLGSLDVSSNVNLVKLSCGSNQLGSLDVSKNASLEELKCESNKLTSLNLSGNVLLKVLFCGWNPNLESLDLSKNTSLTELNCVADGLTGLILGSKPSLISLSCQNNQLKSLDVSQSTSLINLCCGYNQMQSLDVSHCGALKYLHCGQNQLERLDVSRNPLLDVLDCPENQLTGLDVSKNPNLTTLYCGRNRLSSLDVSGNPALLHLLWDDQTAVPVTPPVNTTEPAEKDTEASEDNKDGNVQLPKKLTLREGESVSLKQKVSSLGKADFKSSNKKVATVTAKGVIKGKKAGKAKITIKAGKKKYTVSVTVKKKVSLPKKISIKKGETVSLQKALSALGQATCKSSDNKVASVTKKGVIKGKKVGKAKITIKAGKKKYTVSVTVKKK